MSTLARFFARATAIVAFAVAGPAANATDLTTQGYIDIEQLYATYNQAIDSGDAEAWAATFTPDGSFNTGFKGKEGLMGFVQMWREKMNGANRRHWNSNLRITPSADGATAMVNLMLLDVSTKAPVIASTGLYTDALVRTPEGWRFKSRKVHGDVPTPPAAPPRP